MLLEFKSDLQTFVVSHLPVKAVIHQCIGDLSPSNEDLIQMSTQLVGDGAGVDSTSKVEEVELTVEVGDVVVKVTTYYHHCSSILLDDILDDIDHSLCSLHFEVLLPRFEVAVQYLHLMSPSCQSHPAEICAQRLHQRQLHFVRCCYPTSSTSL
jgi:hypothetical protein